MGTGEWPLCPGLYLLNVLVINVCLLSKNLQDLKQRKKLLSSTTFNIKRLVSDNVFYVSLMVLSLKFPRIN